MGWRNKKGEGGDPSSRGSENSGKSTTEGAPDEEKLGKLLRAKPSEGDQLSGSDFEIRKEILLTTLLNAESHLQFEIYRCIVPVGTALGPVCLVLFDRANGPWQEVEPGSHGVWAYDHSPITQVPQRISEGIVTYGPCNLLCGKPTLGAMPWVCAEHWLAVRKYEPDVQRRLKRETRRLLNK